MCAFVKNEMALALAGLALAGIADTNAWKRMDCPDYMRRWPQLKGVMLGSSTEKEFRGLRDMGATLQGQPGCHLRLRSLQRADQPRERHLVP